MDRWNVWSIETTWNYEKIDLREYYRNWLEAKFSRLEVSKGYSKEALRKLREPYKKYLETQGRIGQEI